MALLEKTSTQASKRCCHCKRYRMVGDFWRNKSRGDGLQPACKECEYERKKEYMKEYMKKYLPGWRFQNPNYFVEWHKSHPNHYKDWVQAHPLYKVERYHRIQDEAGCHRSMEDFYPAYRFLKALETAEVVEIKL